MVSLQGPGSERGFTQRNKMRELAGVFTGYAAGLVMALINSFNLF